ncbi:hypothetical protein LIER_31073 [Lithospermum erythrorhizon]|uniref:At1g61900-like C-terminal domain-containing protein n=1 Tax=Lithospermum erythrorhizon TaxID=34254 RepID=A0AAV3RPS2_LITER
MALVQLITLLFFHCLHKSNCVLISGIVNNDKVAMYYSSSPSMDPLYPSDVPSPLSPFTDISAPKLSGHCTLNFSAFESILQTTATDCWSPLAPYLANVVCCPQYEALLEIVVGQSSIHSGKMSSNVSQATYCISDVEKIIASLGANKNLDKICSVNIWNFTESACPVIEAGDIENSIDLSTILVACQDIDPATECCNYVCGDAISAAAEKLASRNHTSLSSHVPGLLPEEQSTSFYTCKKVVMRWLASKINPSAANKVLRGLSSCKLNKACPLVFPNIKNVSENCANVITNHTSCCLAMDSYMSHLQQQSFITNMQALNCATLLGSKLQKANVSRNIYDLCDINLEDFSVQIDSKDSGCLLPSLPLDATYDNTSGIGFICELDDNIRAPWSSASFTSSNCNTTGTADNSLKEVPKTSNQHGILVKDTMMCLLLASMFTCIALLLLLL